MVYISAVEHLGIALEHDIDEQYQYQPGEIIRGHIGLTLSRQMFIRSIFVSVHGEGAVAWEDPDLGAFGSFQTSEVYLNASKSVVESKENKAIILDKGYHEFEFEYQLPDELPSSFIGKYGSVTYVMKAICQGEKLCDTNITSEPFLIVRQTSLPDFTVQSRHAEAEKRFWGTCSFGKVKVDFSVNRTGGVPGEDFFVTAEVANKSPIRITAIQAALVMNSVYHAQKKSIPFRQIVNKRRDEYELVEGDGRRWQNVRLTIPPYIPETRLEFCDIIDVSYCLQFRVETSGGKEIKVEIPIMIGARPAGLELPPIGESENINRYWNKESVSNGYHRGGLGQPRDLYADHYHEDEMDHHHGNWHGGVPELRGPDFKVVNPIFDKPGMRYDSPSHRRSEELPEIIENTKL